MAKLKVDGKEIEVPDHFTLLQACEEAGTNVPVVAFRRNRSGWYAALPFDDLAALLELRHSA